MSVIVTFLVAPVYTAQRNAEGFQYVNPLDSTWIHIHRYEDPSHTISIGYPDSWKILTAEDESIRMVSAGSPPANFSIYASSFTSLLPLIQLVASDINHFKWNLTNFKLNDSEAVHFSGNDAYKIVYSYQEGTHQLKVMRLWTSIPGEVIHIVYSSQLENYSHYLPSVQAIINSLRVQSASQTTMAMTHYASLRTGADPWDLIVNPATNTMYITNPLSNTISVFDGSTDRILNTIDSNSSPSAMSLNPSANRLYVANFGSNTVSVIDTSTYKILADINVGTNPTGLAIDSLSGGLNSLIFVANSASNTVSVLNGLTNKVLTDITVGREPQALSVNMLTKTLYVANSASNTVSVIDYFISQSGDFKYTTRTIPALCVSAAAKTTLIS